ncbi:hypothetical protein F4819DRAFT_435559 [Hypoxylon fuscum]|nr:hypothetical protein F4819DRAFT_435559 [Hypoxylon fuscum]
MHARVFLSTTLAAVASAQVPGLAKRDVIEARQRRPQAFDDQCRNALASAQPLYSDLPTPPPSLLSMSLPSDPCATSAAFSGDVSAASQFSSYTAEVMGWFTSHSAQLESALAPCPTLASYITQKVPICTSSAGGSVSTGSTTAGPTSTTTGSPLATPNAAARNSQFVHAAAGLLGAIAVL